MGGTTISLVRSIDRAWDFYGADPAALNCPDLAAKLREDILSAGFTLAIDPPQFYRFSGGGNGISFLAMLMESHAAIHTAPEKGNCLEITIHTCEVSGLDIDTTPALKTKRLKELWVKRFNPTSVKTFRARPRADQQDDVAASAA